MSLITEIEEKKVRMRKRIARKRMSDGKERNYVIQNYKAQTQKPFFFWSKSFFFSKHGLLRELKSRKKKVENSDVFPNTTL